MEGRVLLLVVSLVWFLKVGTGQCENIGKLSSRGDDAPMPPWLQQRGSRLRVSCPRKCVCYFNVAYCMQKNLLKVPIPFPPQIQFLYLEKNQIQRVPPNRLGQYQTLTKIVLSENKISNNGIRRDSFANLPTLSTLDLSRNNLSSFPDSLPPSLVEIRLASNKISVINVEATANLSQLSGLYLDDNRLTNESIEADALQSLTSLINLDLSGNGLKWVPQHLPSNLNVLKVEDNRLSFVGGEIFSTPSQLHHLYLRGNMLNVESFTITTWNNMGNLEFMDLSENQFRFIPGSLPTSLRQLIMETNNIAEIHNWAFYAVPNIEQIRLAFNKIRMISPGTFFELSHLTYLDISHNKLTYIPRNMPESLLHLHLEYNQIHEVQLDSFCPLFSYVSQPSNIQVLRLHENPLQRSSVPNYAFHCLTSIQVLQL